MCSHSVSMGDALLCRSAVLVATPRASSTAADRNSVQRRSGVGRAVWAVAATTSIGSSDAVALITGDAATRKVRRIVPFIDAATEYVMVVSALLLISVGSTFDSLKSRATTSSRHMTSERGLQVSSFVYGALTRKREEATPNTSTTTSSPGLGSYVDTLAALVPAEVLGLHAAVLSLTTTTVQNSNGEAVTTITDPLTLKWAFGVLLLFSIALYLIGHQRQRWDRLDIFRAAIPPLAFIGWTMAQKATAFDAFFPNLSQTPRDVAVLLFAAILGTVTALLAVQADQKTPVPVAGQ